MVMHKLTIRSLAAFRDVNVLAREIADTVTKFRAVLNQAPLTLRATIKVNRPWPLSIAMLDAALIDDS